MNRKILVAFLVISWIASFNANCATLTPSALRDGSIVISLTGQIDPADGARFRGLVQGARNLGYRVSYLVLNSPGGSVGAGVDLAISVNENKISTIVPAGAMCASACFMPYAAGARKYYSPTSRIGVHSVTDMRYGENVDAKSMTIDMGRFLAALGTPSAIIGKMITMPPNQIAWLSPAELSLIANSSPLRQKPSQTYITSIQPVVQSTPARPITKTNRAEARKLNAEAIPLIRSNQAHLAVPLLSRAYALSPFDAEIAGNYGYALYLDGSLAQARDVLALALKLAPRRGSTWNNLGLTLAALNQVDWAAECFVNYYTYSSRKDIAYSTMISWEENGPPGLQAAVSNARRRLGLR